MNATSIVPEQPTQRNPDSGRRGGLAALGAVAALITECTIEVERSAERPATNGRTAMTVPTEEIMITKEP